MRTVFMGTPDFAVPSLKRLIESKHEVLAVFTQPDKPVGRKQILTAPPVKQLANEYGIPVYQPERIKGSDSAVIIKSLNPDIIIVVAYGKILPAEILNAAEYGCINVHASLLPKYRGAAPIQWAVINGDSESGVSIMQMDEGLDTGDILNTVKTDIDINETSESLFCRLSLIGADALIDTLSLIEEGKVNPVKQPPGDFGYAKMISKELCPIDWNNSALSIHNKVRGLQSWPVANTLIKGKTVKIHETRLTEMIIDNSKSGEIIECGKRLIVSCGDGKCLEITSLQPEGKRKMTSQAFLQGNKLEIGQILGE